MSDWVWVRPEAVSAIHDRQLSEHGGPAGTRDSGALKSALTRPQNLAACGDPDAASLAAAYAFGIARNHPFVDGNKRTAWMLARLFLAANGVPMRFDKQDATRTVLALAAGEIGEEEFATWLRAAIQTA